MRNRKFVTGLQRKRQLHRQHTKMMNRRQEFFAQVLMLESIEQKEFN